MMVVHQLEYQSLVPKLVSFLLVCRVCGTERLVHRQPYEPRSEPHP